MENAQGDISGVFMTPSQESAQSEAGWPGRSSGFQNGSPPKAKRQGQCQDHKDPDLQEKDGFPPARE